MSSTYWKDSPLLTGNSLEKLAKFSDLILRWNARINLTGYRQREEVDDLLIGESVLAAGGLNKAGLIQPQFRVLDFGSGAGIPGLVWATLDLPIHLTSLEIRQKKVAFQKEVVRELGLKCRMIAGRFPEAVAAKEFDLIVSRAIRYDRNIWTAGEHCLVPSGKFVRFAPPGTKEKDWSTIEVSARTSLLVKSVPNSA